MEGPFYVPIIGAWINTYSILLVLLRSFETRFPRIRPNQFISFRYFFKIIGEFQKKLKILFNDNEVYKKNNYFSLIACTNLIKEVIDGFKVILETHLSREQNKSLEKVLNVRYILIFEIVRIPQGLHNFISLYRVRPLMSCVLSIVLHLQDVLNLYKLIII
ncbi:hypothetical protein MXB_2638 [Myxobolus squamalis]|nr:hypothetical protein MXB_2638 [Myxobolus squamalis]